MLHRVTALHILAEFGSTGAIGPLHCGASLNDITAALGPPWDIGPVSKRRRWPPPFLLRRRRALRLPLPPGNDDLCPDLARYHRPPARGVKTIASHPGHLTRQQITSAHDWMPLAAGHRAPAAGADRSAGRSHGRHLHLRDGRQARTDPEQHRDLDQHMRVHTARQLRCIQ